MVSTKKLLLFLLIALPVATVAGQTIEFYSTQVRGLEKTLTLHGTYGKATETRYLWLTNNTQQTLRVFARPHVDGNVLYFMDAQGTTKRDYSLEIAPGKRIALQMFGFLDKGAARTCSGYLALAATPLLKNGTKGETRTVKLPAILTFDGSKSKVATKPMGQAEKQSDKTKPASRAETPSGKPDRYDVVTYEGLPMRWHLYQLPLKVFSDHQHTGDTAAQYASVVRRTVDIWNQVARENGLKKDFFKIVQSSAQADIRLDWRGKYLLPGALGTAYPSDGRIGMLPLRRYQGLGRAGETLLQELCHMLGVAHSEMYQDIMFHRARDYCPDLAKLGVTARDKQMLGWLYKQKRYVAFRD